MRSFAEAYPNREMVKQLVSQIPWGHNIHILQKIKILDDRLWCLLLCKSKNDVVVEYALDGYRRPMGVAQWETQLTQSLPDDLKGSLPSIAEIEAELKEKEVGNYAE